MTKHTKSMGFPTEQLSHSHTYLIYTRYVMLFFFFLVFKLGKVGNPFIFNKEQCYPR